MSLAWRSLLTRAATNVGDEGGFAPNVQGAEESLDILTEAIAKAGYAGKVKIGLYVLRTPRAVLTSQRRRVVRVLQGRQVRPRL